MMTESAWFGQPPANGYTNQNNSIGDTIRSLVFMQGLIKRRAAVTLARRHPGHLAEYAFDIKLAPFHWEWLDFALERDRGLLMASRGHGKKTQYSVVLPLWFVGDNPNVRIAII